MTEVKLLININYDHHLLITPERIKLLRKIQKTGSLNAASKEMSISYQNAWTMIDEINKLTPTPIVIKQRGGSHGGGAVISEFGKLLLKEYSFIEQLVLKFNQKINTEINL